MKLNQICAGIRWTHQKIDRAPPPVLFVGYLFFGVVMLLATAVLNMATIDVGGEAPRLKGYWWELNWGVNHLILIPVGLFCSALVLRRLRDQVTRISALGMVVDKHFKALNSKTVVQEWERYRPGPVWFSIIAVVSFSASWWEWVDGSFAPLMGIGGRDNPGWTSGALLNPSISRWANLILSFLAYTAQGFVATLFCYVFASVLASSIWIYSYSDAEERKLVPNIGSLDIRRGFEEFEPMVFSLLYMAMSFTVVLFFIRIESLYDYSASTARSVFHFILEDVVTGFFVSVSSLFRGGQRELFDVGMASNYSTVIVCAAMSVILAMVLVIPTLILSLLARQSRDSLVQCLALDECPPCAARKLEKGTCEERARSMDFWPLRYPRPMELLGFVVVAGFCFFFYRFTFLLFGALVIRMVWIALKGLRTPPITKSEDS